MKVKVLKNVGDTGFRAIGTEYDIPDNRAQFFIKRGYVAKVVAEELPPKAAPIVEAEEPKAKPKRRKPATKKSK